MKRKMLLVLLAVGLTLSGCSGGKNAPPSRGTLGEPVEEPAKETEEVVPEESEEQEPVEEPEKEALPLTYVEEHGLEFSQEVSFTIQGDRYDQNNLSDYEFTDLEETILGVDVEDSETEGYEIVKIKTSALGYSGIFGDSSRLVLEAPSMNICDIYTGKVAMMRRTMCDAEMTAGKDLEWAGESYSIEHTVNVEWDFADWTTDAQGNDVVPGTCYATYTITVPKGYDGLGLVIYPVTEGPSEDEFVAGAVTVDVTEQYIMDEWTEGSYLFRVSDLYEILKEKIYVPGVYTSSMTLGGNSVRIAVTVDESTIVSIEMENVSEEVLARYYSIKSAFDELVEQIISSQSLDNIEYSEEYPYSSQMVLQVIEKALNKALVFKEDIY